MKVIVDAGAWQLAINVLQRDADSGLHVRAEIVEELKRATETQDTDELETLRARIAELESLLSIEQHFKGQYAKELASVQEGAAK